MSAYAAPSSRLAHDQASKQHYPATAPMEQRSLNHSMRLPQSQSFSTPAGLQHLGKSQGPSHLQFPFFSPSPSIQYPPGTILATPATSSSFFPPAMSATSSAASSPLSTPSLNAPANYIPNNGSVHPLAQQSFKSSQAFTPNQLVIPPLSFGEEQKAQPPLEFPTQNRADSAVRAFQPITNSISPRPRGDSLKASNAQTLDSNSATTSPFPPGTRVRTNSSTSASSIPGSMMSSADTLRQQKVSNTSTISVQSLSPSLPAGAKAVKVESSQYAQASGLARPSPLSHNANLASSPEKAKKTGFGKLKAAFKPHVNDDYVKGHEKGRPSVNSNLSNSSSTSATSSSPPRTPPDLEGPLPLYANNEANLSNATLPNNNGTFTQQKPSKRLGIFNSKMNGSTDNLSISSTMSSASMMIRKIGTLGGRLTKRGSIGSMFNRSDKSDGASENDATPPRSKLKKERKLSNLSSETAKASPISPAAALVQRQQQIYAEQEAAANAGTTLKERERQTSNDKRLLMIEKEKEKLKGRKAKKWGVGSFSGGNSVSYAATQPIAAPVDDFGTPAIGKVDAEHSEHVEYAPSRRSVDGVTMGDRPLSALEGDLTLSGVMQEDLAAEGDITTSNSPYMGYDDSASEDENANLYRGYQHLPFCGRPPLPHNAKPARSILKVPSSSHLDREVLEPPQMDHARIRSNSYDNPRKNSARFTSASQSYVDSPDGSPSPSPSLNGPYSNASLNISAPVINTKAIQAGMRSASTPTANSRRCVFAPNLSVHQTWPPSVYDRRGEVATCNKLTPLLAQRIKEELNAYKLNEMDVHGSSRIYTHFFA